MHTRSKAPTPKSSEPPGSGTSTTADNPSLQQENLEATGPPSTATEKRKRGADAGSTTKKKSKTSDNVGVPPPRDEEAPDAVPPPPPTPPSPLRTTPTDANKPVTGNTPASFGNVLVTNTSSIDLPPPLLDEERLEMEMDEDADVDDSNSEPLQSSITSPTVAKASAASTVTLAASVRLSVPMGTTLPKKKAKNERTPEEKRESNAKRKARSQELAQALEALYDVLIKDCERIGKQFDETPEDILSRLCLTYENKHSRAPTAWNGFLKWKAQTINRDNQLLLAEHKHKEAGTAAEADSPEPLLESTLVRDITVAYHDEYNAAKANDPESMASWLQIAKESAVQKKETKSLVKVGTSAATEMTKIWNKWDLEMIMCQQRTKALSLAFMCRGDTTVTWDAHYHCSPQLVNFLSNCYGIDMSQLAKAMEVFALTQQDGLATVARVNTNVKRTDLTRETNKALAKAAGVATANAEYKNPWSMFKKYHVEIINYPLDSWPDPSRLDALKVAKLYHGLMKGTWYFKKCTDERRDELEAEHNTLIESGADLTKEKGIHRSSLGDKAKKANPNSLQNLKSFKGMDKDLATQTSGYPLSASDATNIPVNSNIDVHGHCEVSFPQDVSFPQVDIPIQPPHIPTHPPPIYQNTSSVLESPSTYTNAFNYHNPLPTNNFSRTLPSVLQAQPQLVTPPSDHTYSPQLTLPTQTSGFVDFNQSLEELPSSVLNMDRDTGSNDDQFSMYWS